MIKFRHLGCVLFVFFGLATCYLCGWPNWAQFSFNSAEVNRSDANRESTTLIKKNDWVEFQLDTASTNLRILTNSAVSDTSGSGQSQTDPRPGWRYAVRYQLLDPSRNVIRDSIYHFRSRVRQLFDDQTGQTIYPLFFGRSSLIATQTRVMQIPVNQAGQNQTAYVRLKLESADPEISEVVARVTSRILRQKFDRRQTWNRISRETKQRISKYCVYSHHLLTNVERTNLLRWQWVQAPTVGQQEGRFLFFVGDIDDQEIGQDFQPAGVPVASEFLATIPVPEGEGRLRLEIQRREPATFGKNTSAKGVEIQWFGAGPGNRKQIRHDLDAEGSPIELDVNGGIVQVDAEFSAMVRAFWAAKTVGHQKLTQQEPTTEQGTRGQLSPAQLSSRIPAQLISHHKNDSPSKGIESTENIRRPEQPRVDAGPVEITPSTGLVRCFLIDKRNVGFRITHVDDRPTPFRCSFRVPFGDLFYAADSASVTKSSSIEDSVPIEWNYLDEYGQVVASGQLQVTQHVSKYDCLWVGNSRHDVSDASTYFFSIPREVCEIRFVAPKCPVLTVSSVRPEKLRRITRVPEDYQAYTKTRSTSRVWFPLKPNHHQRLVQENRSFVLRSQIRPTQPNDAIETGDYDWKRFVPQGAWIGQQILVPRVPNSQKLSFGLGDYEEIGANQKVAFGRLKDECDRPRPVKLILAGNESLGQVLVQCNGILLYHNTIHSKRFQFELKQISDMETGELEVSTDSQSRCFVSGLVFESGRAFVKRLAQRLDGDTLRFTYRKSSNESEVVTLQVFGNPYETSRRKIHVTIEPHDDIHRDSFSPSLDWTVFHRTYDLQPITSDAALLLDSDALVDSGRRCFIRLGSDLPKGDYTIQVSQEKAAGKKSVLMYRSVPGKTPKRSISIHSDSDSLQ